MPLKHGTSAALERRMDLASFFCMIGRHGPAVVLAVLAVLCLLAGLVVYWRMKRGRKRSEATAAAGDGGTAAAAVETDASVDKRPGLRARSGGPNRLNPAESTEGSEDGLSQIKEDLLHQHVTLRHRHVTASEKIHGLDSPAKRDVQEPAIRETGEVRDWATEAESEEEPVGDTMEEVPSDGREEPEPIQSEACVTRGTALEEEDLQRTEDYDAKKEEEELVPQEDQMDPSITEEPRAWTGSPQIDQETPGRMEGVVLSKEFHQAKREVPSIHETAELHSSSPVPSPTLPDQDSGPASVGPSPEFPTHEDSLELDCKQLMSEEIEVPGSLPVEEEEELPASVPDELSKKAVDLHVMTQNVQMEIDNHEVSDPTMAENQESVEDCSDLMDHDSGETITNEEVARPALMSHERPDHIDIITKEFNGPGLTICSCKNNDTFVMSEETSVPHQEMQNTTQQICLPRFLLRDADHSPGFRAESGISSMTVTPDLQDEEFSKMVENMDCDPQCEESELRLYTDDIAASVFHGNSAELSFGPQGPHGEVFAANEDVFGQEIEDRYQRVLEAAMLEIMANVGSILKDQVEAAEIKGCKTAKTEEEEEKEDVYEKTEISIMEATMDHNEWITEGNYQVLPWMNGSSFSQDHWKPPTDVSSIDTDSAPFGDVTGTPPPGEDSTKKVVAVPPMPQNVSVTFRIHYLTHSPHQTLAITGNQPELGNWAEFIPLERAGGGNWVAVVSLPAESHVEWKFAMLEKGEVSRWEECGNRSLDTGYGDELTVHKWWGLL